MDNQKSFREKKLIEILIVVIVIVFLVGSVIFAFVNKTPTPHIQHKVTSSVTQNVLNSLSTSSTTTTKVPQSVLNSMSASKNNTVTTIPQSVIDSLSASPKK